MTDHGKEQLLCSVYYHLIAYYDCYMYE